MKMHGEAGREGERGCGGRSAGGGGDDEKVEKEEAQQRGKERMEGRRKGDATSEVGKANRRSPLHTEVEEVGSPI